MYDFCLRMCYFWAPFQTGIQAVFFQILSDTQVQLCPWLGRRYFLSASLTSAIPRLVQVGLLPAIYQQYP